MEQSQIEEQVAAIFNDIEGYIEREEWQQLSGAAYRLLRVNEDTMPEKLHGSEGGAALYRFVCFEIARGLSMQLSNSCAFATTPADHFSSDYAIVCSCAVIALLKTVIESKPDYELAVDFCNNIVGIYETLGGVS